MSALPLVAPQKNRLVLGEQRRIPSSIYSEFGWMEGSMVVPQERRLVDFLNATPVIRMASVVLPASDRQHAFIAFRPDAMALIVPRTTSNVEPALPPIGLVRRRVSASVGQICISGTIRTPLEIAAADYLKTAPAFFAVFDAHWSTEDGISCMAPIVIVNREKVSRLANRA